MSKLLQSIVLGIREGLEYKSIPLFTEKEKAHLARIVHQYVSNCIVNKFTEYGMARPDLEKILQKLLLTILHDSGITQQEKELEQSLLEEIQIQLQEIRSDWKD